MTLRDRSRITAPEHEGQFGYGDVWTWTAIDADTKLVFTRLTNAFFEKVENLAAAVSLHFLYYNFARPHMALMGQTPAMKTDIADHQWTVTEIAALLDRKAQRASN